MLHLCVSTEEHGRRSQEPLKVDLFTDGDRIGAKWVTESQGCDGWFHQSFLDEGIGSKKKYTSEETWEVPETAGPC